MTKPTEHTPWVVADNSASIPSPHIVVFDSEGYEICRKSYRGIELSSEDLANMTLIASIPEMQDRIDELGRVVKYWVTRSEEAEDKITAQQAEIDSYKVAIEELQELYRGVTEKACEDQAEIDRLTGLLEYADIMICAVLAAQGRPEEFAGYQEGIDGQIDAMRVFATTNMVPFRQERAALKPESETNDA